MTTGQIILLVLGLVVGLPIISYMVVKFGAAGYFRAKRKDRQSRPERGAD